MVSDEEPTSAFSDHCEESLREVTFLLDNCLGRGVKQDWRLTILVQLYASHDVSGALATLEDLLKEKDASPSVFVNAALNSAADRKVLGTFLHIIAPLFLFPLIHRQTKLT